ncbi:lipocalin family protein [Chitinimonas sp. BJB300]|uniref:lipocalin family protein n=1 Tax=Chitinimonas sp. BJB300 TaxID=1559339 RepID=UPI000C0C769E|nr:lipocalin family protein [Chitinimonas sp. BJB300]PHV09897.1 lipocalin [Chitinimonas sp. BJB300]TSJ87236.1 lipocalin family protein [Chitinimonas sp. BJB300]
MTIFKIFATSAFLLGGAIALAQPIGNLKSISTLNVNRYLGLWHEMAKFPNEFQKKCVSDTSAEYSLMPDGSIKVLNQCRRQNGQMDQAIGLAKQIGNASSSKLQVRFAPAWLSFLPFVWGDYWVIDLDEKYELAAVSEPKREYLWILSRSHMLDETSYTALLTRLTAMGFDVSKLEKTIHGKQ